MFSKRLENYYILRGDILSQNGTGEWPTEKYSIEIRESLKKGNCGFTNEIIMKVYTNKTFSSNLNLINLIQPLEDTSLKKQHKNWKQVKTFGRNVKLKTSENFLKTCQIRQVDVQIETSVLFTHWKNLVLFDMSYNISS